MTDDSAKVLATLGGTYYWEHRGVRCRASQNKDGTWDIARESWMHIDKSGFGHKKLTTLDDAIATLEDYLDHPDRPRPPRYGGPP